MGIGWFLPGKAHPSGVKECKFRTASPYLAIEVNDSSPNPAIEVNIKKKISGPNFLDSHMTVLKLHVISAPNLCIVSLALSLPLIISNMNHRFYSCCFNGHSESHYREHEKCKTACFFVLPDEREQAEIIVAEVKSVFDNPNRMAFAINKSELSSKILHSWTHDPGKQSLPCLNFLPQIHLPTKASLCIIYLATLGQTWYRNLILIQPALDQLSI